MILPHFHSGELLLSLQNPIDTTLWLLTQRVVIFQCPAGIIIYYTLRLFVRILYCFAKFWRDVLHPSAHHRAWHFVGPRCCNSELKDELMEASGTC